MSDSDQVLTSSSDKILTDYERHNVSMMRLIKSLLASSTMPHVALIVMLSSVLYIIAGFSSLTVFSSIAFTSLSLAYAITALLSGNATVSRWITLDNDSERGNHGLVLDKLMKFRVCLFPIISAVIIFFLVLILTGENGIISDFDQLFPTALGMLFVAWSIVQGNSFSKWASSNSARNFQTAKQPSNHNLSILVTMVVIGIFCLIISTLFYQFDNISQPLSDSVLASIPFSITTLALISVSLGYSWKLKKLASMKASLQHFSARWTFMCHLFIAWHLMTIWRQNFLDPSTVQVFVEEIILMILTVFFAIWSMTAKGYKSSFRLITEENALTWGLAFGYAYAGSVAMLTSFFDNIKIVMLIGHSVVVLTVVLLHKRVLNNVIVTDDYDVDISRITAVDEKTNHYNKHSDRANDVNSKASSDDEETGWQEDTDVDWEKVPTEPQIDGVDWDETIDLD